MLKLQVDGNVLKLFVLAYLLKNLGGKGEGAAGIFEAWDVNYDGKITLQEVY